MDKDNSMEKGFYEEFDFEGKKYLAHIQHYLCLSEDDLITYKVIDGEFLIHLYSLQGCKSFKVFLNDELMWQTNSSKFHIASELVEAVGMVIDMKHFYS